MGSYQAPMGAWPRCAHGRTPFDGCGDCCAEREAERVEILRSVNDPQQAITDALVNGRPWFKRCGLCRWGRRGPDLVQDERHDYGCPFVLAMADARDNYTLHWLRSTEHKGESR